METFVSFFGVIIPPGKDEQVNFEDEDLDASTTLHLTQLALGSDASPGDHTVYIETNGESFALGTLNKDKCPHFKLDIILVDEDVTLRHTGKSKVHLTGYKGISFGHDMDSDDEYAHLFEGSDDDDSDDDSEESEEEEEAPEGVPLGMKGLPSPDSDDSFDGDEISDDDLDVSEDDSEDDDDDSEDDDSEDDEDEDGDMKMDAPQAEEEEEEDDDEEEEEDSDEDDEEEEIEDTRKRVKEMRTPQPEKKKIKMSAPASAPSKVDTSKTPTNEKEYTAALKQYLVENGPSKLSALGTAVKRPGSVPKLKKFLSTNASIFAYNQSTDTVSLS